MPEAQPIFLALRRAGIDPAPLLQPGTAHLLASGHHVIRRQSVPGLELAVDSRPDEIAITLTIGAGRCLEQPVHLCLGLFEPTGEQNVRLRATLEAGAEAHVLAHCLFPHARAATHRMQAEILLGENSRLHYDESHLHGPSGGVQVFPRAGIRLARDARLFAAFALVSGRVGRLDIDYEVEVGENAVAEMHSRVHARADDRVRIRERLVLAGIGARGLIKTRLAACDDARAEVIGITEGCAAGARGHVDCLEIVRDRACVSANPLVKVSHPLAKVTHEAAIGSVDQPQLETLMARGLDPEAAVDLIVSRILRPA